jgi:pyridoxal phosphate enzyme (YggS family)
MNNIENLHTVTANIDRVQKYAPIGSQRPSLIAVSKSQSIEAILPFLGAGQLVYGENRVQEAGLKWDELRKHYPDSELHLIGALQTNKVKESLSLFDVIQTIDRKELVDAIIKERQKIVLPRCRQFFVQVNIGEELQKNGISLQALPQLLEYCHKQGLGITGLMCVPPAEDWPAPYFALLYTIASKYGLPQLSMGMSNDYETALRLGATHIRIGTALFGEREVRKE